MRRSLLVSGALVLLGLGVFLYKVFGLHYPLTTSHLGSTWRVELVIHVSGKGARVVVDASLPGTSGYQTLLSEQVRSGPLRFSITEENAARTGRWSGRLSGAATVSYQVTVQTREYARAVPDSERRRSYPESVRPYLREAPAVQASDPAIAALGKELALEGGDKVKLAREIFEFVSREIGHLQSTGEMDALATLREGRGTPLGRARLFCALARAYELPCRIVSGIFLEDGTHDALHHWNEVYLGGAWVPADAVMRRFGTIPAGRLALAWDSGNVIRQEQTTSLSYRFDVQSELETYLHVVERRLSESSHPLDRVSLLLLPVQVQRHLRLLLLVPVGALAIAVFRSIVGFRTFGTFMPMLIALAFTATGLLYGTVFLTVVILGALATRLLIQRLYLLMVARVAFILTVVVLLLVVLMVATDRFRLPSEGISAFPFVIITMVVERMSVSLEEEGWRNTMNRLAATVLAIYFTYAVIQARWLQSFLLVFPEVLFVILGMLVLVGRYTGYRLVELLRFRELATEPAGTG
ncbi:MAG: gonadoliberin III [Candidatus Binatia bacterium]|nr:MAG: gonadoliberin III [Candidatus Binatia bacterium]